MTGSSDATNLSDRPDTILLRYVAGVLSPDELAPLLAAFKDDPLLRARVDAIRMAAIPRPVPEPVRAPGLLRSAPGIALVAAISALALVEAALLIGRGSSAPSVDGSASGEVVEVGTILIIGFREDATMGEVARLLASIEARMIDGPSTGGLWRARIGSVAMPDDARDRMMDDLKRHPLVRLVMPGGPGN